MQLLELRPHKGVDNQPSTPRGSRAKNDKEGLYVDTLLDHEIEKAMGSSSQPSTSEPRPASERAVDQAGGASRQPSTSEARPVIPWFRIDQR